MSGEQRTGGDASQRTGFLIRLEILRCVFEKDQRRFSLVLFRPRIEFHARLRVPLRLRLADLMGIEASIFIRSAESSPDVSSPNHGLPLSVVARPPVDLASPEILKPRKRLLLLGESEWSRRTSATPRNLQ